MNIKPNTKDFTKVFVTPISVNMIYKERYIGIINDTNIHLGV